MKRTIVIAAILVLAFAIASARTSAQAPANNDVNAALIRELHDLRIAIEKLASASSRVQMLSARVTQEEQRISNLTSQLIPLNNKLAESVAETTMKNATVEHLKDRIRVEPDPKQRASLEEQQADLTADLNRSRFMQSSVQAQVDGLHQQIVVEQSNLSDLQRRLDELDRSMVDTQK
jgi:peptidoglycan hydrolase CwlO-like protein